ncbi:hypothetical protein [Legionella brunensis]|uniref:Uncharacterized protein n=1 Tax=Legionella brunensis TaxID=29422 RepID=A0A0W0SKE2_9GAMM|nr:hypothetical protein [Legionella brunensis]KTC83839.1 hypothetical protein Lbru_1662 [Legionella brunensis]
MKKNLLIGFIAAMSFAGVLHADFTFYASDSNTCEYVAGQWVGKGKASNWLLGECVYQGSGTVGPVDSQGNFTLEVTADKNSGNILCPDHAHKELSGTCNNGVVKIITEYGNLSGNFSRNAGDAKGKLTVAPGVSADITVRFQRAG